MLRRLFAGATVIWAAAVPLASWAAARPTPAPIAYPFAFVVYAIGSLICHQRPERSFTLWSAQLPVCARCTGIYLGAAGAVVVSRARRWPFDVRIVLALASAPTIASLVFEWTTGIMPANWVRAIAGVPLGAAAAWLVVREERKVN